MPWAKTTGSCKINFFTARKKYFNCAYFSISIQSHNSCLKAKFRRGDSDKRRYVKVWKYPSQPCEMAELGAQLCEVVLQAVCRKRWAPSSGTSDGWKTEPRSGGPVHPPA